MVLRRPVEPARVTGKVRTRTKLAAWPVRLPVEHMFSQRMIFRQLWMIKIACHVTDHANFLHHMTRADVSLCRERDNLRKMHSLKAEREGCARSFRCEVARAYHVLAGEDRTEKGDTTPRY